MNVVGKLIGNSGVIQALATGSDASPAANANRRQFPELRQKFLLYH
jgi:hypothetical protein